MKLESLKDEFIHAREMFARNDVGRLRKVSFQRLTVSCSSQVLASSLLTGWNAQTDIYCTLRYGYVYKDYIVDCLRSI